MFVDDTSEQRPVDTLCSDVSSRNIDHPNQKYAGCSPTLAFILIVFYLILSWMVVGLTGIQHST